mmetsp:Transcript_30207/g.50167  ORF Transcript_30207/g.50167 Transcript_30207/m.50167 type:complete len:209 (-) Transcript_30207:1562-2188(-)
MAIQEDTNRGMKSMERKNSNNSSSSDNGEPNAINPNDVLCGRGGLTNSHVGNKRFRYIVAEYQQVYLNARKNEKKEIARTIVARIHGNGGRFLRRTADSGVWSEVTYKKATEKTSQALREGLDVRHKTVRPEKLIHLTESDDSNPRKRARLVEGLVMESPNLLGMSGGEVPDLKEEEQPSLMAPTFDYFLTFLPKSHSEAECKHVEQI